MKRTKILAIFVCLLFIGTMFVAAAVVAPKPPKPPKPDPDSGPTGTIYYRTLDEESIQYVYSANPDGSSRTKEHLWHGGKMSNSQHGGHWWYVGFRGISGTYPDGQTKMEIFAVRDDGGKLVTLTLDPNLSVDSYSCIPMWNKDDSTISWSSLVWTKDSMDNDVVNGAGLYKASVSWDSNGDVTGFGTITLVKSCDTWLGYDDVAHPEIREIHDWSPDGTKVVYFKSGSGSFIYNTETDTETFLISAGIRGWSPDGNYICYQTYHDLWIIKPDGTGNTQVLKNKKGGLMDRVTHPEWSADSKYLFYRYYTVNDNTYPNTYTFYLYVIGIDGSGKKCVTNGLGGDFIITVAWR